MKRLAGRGGTFLWAAVLPGLLFSCFLLFRAHAVNGRNGFPLDDPWIHLTYARNLHDAHSFSYFPGEAATQGSTSPLYTFLLALGFGITRDEKVLSYVLGLIFHTLFLGTCLAWAKEVLRSKLWVAAAVLFIGLDPNIGILSVSGMETSLFLFLVALIFTARHRRSFWILGTASGLAVWVRPDALILLVLLFVDAGLEARLGPAAKETPSPWWRRPLWQGVLPAAVLLAAYGVFNIALGGSLLPNTFAAKTAYYRPSSRALFITQQARHVFFAGGWIILLPFCLMNAGRELILLLRRRPSGLRLEAGWAVGLPLAYLVLLPFAHRFGRYLVPALPAVALLGLKGVFDLADGVAALLRRPAQGKGKAVKRQGSPGSPLFWKSPLGASAAAILLAAFVLQARAAVLNAPEYVRLCNYHWTRHERTGLWLAENTPADAVVAAHDVGAIAFYSKRKVVDMVGVVQREVTPHLNRPDYLTYLESLFAREKVTHLAVLRNWCEVVNVEQLFQADPQPEIMEVFPYKPGTTHLMPADASEINRQAAKELRDGNLEAAGADAARSLALDGRSSRTWLILGIAQEYAGRLPEAEASYAQALRLFPDYPEGAVRLATVLYKQGKSEQARSVLGALLLKKPGYPGAIDLLKRMDGSSSPDGK